MSAGMFSGLPPFAQFLIYGILGLGITGAGFISYVKGLRKERAAEGRPGDHLFPVEEVGRLVDSMDRLDRTVNRSVEAVHESTDMSRRLYQYLAATAGMPPNEEILNILRGMRDRMQPPP